MSNLIPGYGNRFYRNAGWLLACVAIALLHAGAGAQVVFHGVLLNKIDSSVIPYAAVSAKELNESILTDTKGAFRFTIPENIKLLTLNIAAIGCKATVVYRYPFSKTTEIYLDVLSNALNEFAVEGLSAEEVVKQAVAAIPLNYVDSGYFDYSFYRRYQKVNGRFVNLFEACPAVMFRLSKTSKFIKANEAFAVNQLRRSAFHPDIMNEYEDNPIDLINQNPVYHLYGSSLEPSKLSEYTFSFDTANKSADYVITYVCTAFSSDAHGLANYELWGLKGEEWEKGELVIDRETFAIKKFHRKSIRYKDYPYSKFNIANDVVVYDHHKYLFEFVDGDMEVEYGKYNGRWLLKRMFRQYTNEFYLPVFDTKAYTITDNFEWYSGSVSRYTTSDYADKFYSKLATAIHNYDTGFWNKCNIPFHYADKETIYKSLERDGPVETQFYDETKIDEYPGKLRAK